MSQAFSLIYVQRRQTASYRNGSNRRSRIIINWVQKFHFCIIHEIMIVSFSYDVQLTACKSPWPGKTNFAIEIDGLTSFPHRLQQLENLIRFDANQKEFRDIKVFHWIFFLSFHIDWTFFSLHKHEKLWKKFVEMFEKEKQFQSVVTMDVSFNQYFVLFVYVPTWYGCGWKSVEKPKTNLISVPWILMRKFTCSMWWQALKSQRAELFGLWFIDMTWLHCVH